MPDRPGNACSRPTRREWTLRSGGARNGSSTGSAGRRHGAGGLGARVWSTRAPSSGPARRGRDRGAGGRAVAIVADLSSPTARRLVDRTIERCGGSTSRHNAARPIVARPMELPSKHGTPPRAAADAPFACASARSATWIAQRAASSSTDLGPRPRGAPAPRAYGSEARLRRADAHARRRVAPHGVLWCRSIAYIATEMIQKSMRTTPSESACWSGHAVDAWPAGRVARVIAFSPHAARS